MASDTLAESAELLAAAITEPFFVDRGLSFDPDQGFAGNSDLPLSALTVPIIRWYRMAQRMAPLWCFDKVAFRNARDDDVPSSKPLRDFVERMKADERVPTWRSVPPSSVVANLWSRRIGLADSEMISGVRTQPGVFGIVPGNYMDIDDIGLFKADYHDHLRPDRGPGAVSQYDMQVRQVLFEQGKWLLGVCWQAGLGEQEPTTTARNVLSASGVEEEDHLLSCICLALPMFSIVETAALIAEIGKGIGEKGPETQPRRFTRWCLAHRLEMTASALAKNLSPQSDARYHRDNENPISEANGRSNPLISRR